MKLKFNLKTFLVDLVSILLIGCCFGVAYQTQAKASRTDAYDISAWQGRINNRQSNRLRKEVKFVILRVQHGIHNPDIQFRNNVNKMNRSNIPYGVYGYNLYHNKRQARNEAKALYRRAPYANFYVNDIEKNNAGRRIVSSTDAWANEMRTLTAKPIILYSYEDFINEYLKPTRRHYNAIWIADYAKRRPLTRYKYNLWQYTDRHYSRALGERVDASKLIGKKPLSFWIGRNKNKITIKPARHVNHVNVAQTRNHFHHHQHHLTRHEIHQYHHEMHRINLKLRHGNYHMTRKE